MAPEKPAQGDGIKAAANAWEFTSSSGQTTPPTLQFDSLAAFRNPSPPGFSVAWRFGSAVRGRCNYARHPRLGQRLRECTRLVVEVAARDIADLFAAPDDLKFHSCMLLFARAVPEAPLFEAALARLFGGQPEAPTLRLLSRVG